jgi:hypothetical protein
MYLNSLRVGREGEQIRARASAVSLCSSGEAHCWSPSQSPTATTLPIPSIPRDPASTIPSAVYSRSAKGHIALTPITSAVRANTKSVLDAIFLQCRSKYACRDSLPCMGAKKRKQICLSATIIRTVSLRYLTDCLCIKEGNGPCQRRS